MSWHGGFKRDGTSFKLKFDKFVLSKSEIKGRGKDRDGQFKVTGKYSSTGKVIFAKEYKDKSIYFNGQMNKDSTEITGIWGNQPGQKINEFKLVLKDEDQETAEEVKV